MRKDRAEQIYKKLRDLKREVTKDKETGQYELDLSDEPEDVGQVTGRVTR